jgi:hypothetical protein
MSVAAPAYLEIVDFIAANNPEAVVQFRPSEQAQRRLIEREGTAGLSTDERSELDHFMELEHILRMAKARAREILASGK